MSERIERMTYQYDSPAGMKKPAHMDNPNIIDEENWGQRPKQFSNEDKSSYPSDRDQQQRISSWDAILQSAKGNKEEMKQVRDTLNRAYKSNPSSLTQTELKIIGRGKQPEPIKIDTSGLDRFLRVRKEAAEILNKPVPIPKVQPRQFGGLNSDFVKQKTLEAEILNGPEKDKS